MKFGQVVQLLTHQVIKSICQTHGKSDPALTFLLNEDWVKQCWEAMSEDERQVILFFIKEKGKDILTYRELEQGHIPLSPVRFRVALTKLRRSGFIFTLRRMWGEHAYFMSPEQIELFGKLCVPVSSDWRSQKRLPESISYHILDDLLQVLNVVRNGSTAVSFSKKGTLHTRDIKLLFKDIKITKEKFASLTDLFFPQHPFAIHEAIILDSLIEWGLLKKEQGKLVLGNVEQWVRRDEEDICTEFIVKLFRDRFEPRLFLFFNLIKGLDKTEVYSVQAILRSMGDLAPDESVVMEKCIQPLTDMGFIEIQREQGGTVFQWKSYQTLPDAPMYIQPNFEIIMPAFTSLRMKWELMQIAEILRREEMWVMQLSRDLCQSFFELGNSAADVLKILKRYSTVPIPDNVISSVEQWGKDFEQVSFWDVRLLRISHPELAEEFEQIPAISRLLYEKVGKGCYIVRVKDSETLIEEMSKRGYRVGPNMNLLDRKEEIGGTLLSLWKDQTPEIEEKVESVFPDLDDAIPEWRQIPRMWVSHYSGYRESTMRQLIQQAIQIGLELKIECRGQHHFIHPSQLTNKEGNWTLVVKDADMKSSEYNIEEIDKIQIVSPF